MVFNMSIPVLYLLKFFLKVHALKRKQAITSASVTGKYKEFDSTKKIVKNCSDCKSNANCFLLNISMINTNAISGSWHIILLTDER